MHSWIASTRQQTAAAPTSPIRQEAPGSQRHSFLHDGTPSTDTPRYAWHPGSRPVHPDSGPRYDVAARAAFRPRRSMDPCRAALGGARTHVDASSSSSSSRLWQLARLTAGPPAVPLSGCCDHDCRDYIAPTAPASEEPVIHESAQSTEHLHRPPRWLDPPAPHETRRTATSRCQHRGCR